MRLRNVTTGEIIATDVAVANGWVERIVGLIPQRQVPPTHGLWLPDCSMIHTIGMQADIDVVFLDKEDCVVRTVCAVRRNTLAVACRGARSVVELGCGALEGSDVLVGDRFILEE